MGMFVRTMFWFTTEFWGPNSSAILNVVVSLMAPEQAPMTPVLMYRTVLLLLMSKKKDTDMGIIMITIDAGVDNMDNPLLKHSQSVKRTISSNESQKR